MYEQLDMEISDPPRKTKKHKGLKRFVVIGLLLVAVAGVGYSVYAWQQTQNLQSSLDDQVAKINQLSGQVSSLKSAASAKAVPKASLTNLVSIKELGVSITVPDSIKDLTYSYTSSISSKNTVQSVSFSTQALTDDYASTNECTSYGEAPPLGSLAKVVGQYPVNPAVGKVTGSLVKQFASYYIAYSSPGATCASSQKSVPVELGVFQKSLPTIKEL